MSNRRQKLAEVKYGTQRMYPFHKTSQQCVSQFQSRNTKYLFSRQVFDIVCSPASWNGTDVGGQRSAQH